MSKLFFVGAGGHAKSVLEVAMHDSNFSIAGFFDLLNEKRAGERFRGFEILGGMTELLVSVDPDMDSVFVAVGDCRARLEIASALRRSRYHIPVLKHPQSILSASCKVGGGSLLAAGTCIGPDSLLGLDTIINTNATIEHDCSINDGVHICPSVVVGGHCCIGKGAWIGIGATLKDRVSVGAGSIIGAGSVVVRDIPAGVIAYGNPARVKKITGC